MNRPDTPLRSPSDTRPVDRRHGKSTGGRIAVGLLLGVLCGLMFGDRCAALQHFGQAYVGLLQMTVLPYLVLSLCGKMGRLSGGEARRMGLNALVVLLLIWCIGIVLVVATAGMLPEIRGASFFSATAADQVAEPDLVTRFIPSNIFHALAEGIVPAVVVFCLFFGSALIVVPAKEPVLDLLDLGAAALGQVNVFLIRLAPIGLFMLTAAAAGTVRIEELSRLQGYLMMLGMTCAVATLGILPLLVSSVTAIRFRDVLKAAYEPLLTAIATGKLLVVLPQIVENCERLLDEQDDPVGVDDTTPGVLVPLAYSFPHLGKLLAYVFIPFAAWYVGHRLSLLQTFHVAASGTVSSFAGPLVSMPYLLDRYHLPQDLMTLFILPGFVTMRMGDVVGVMHLMALTLIVNQSLSGRLQIRWRRLLAGGLAIAICVAGLAAAGRYYLASTSFHYDLDTRFLAMEVRWPHPDAIVYRSREEVPARTVPAGETFEHVKDSKLMRVGYHADHLPYSFLNHRQHLVGLDIELIHGLANRLDVQLEFVPYTYETMAEQLRTGEVDLLVGGLLMNPERMLQLEFTQPYQTATMAIVTPDHLRDRFDRWDDPLLATSVRMAAVDETLAAAARRQWPLADIVVIESYRQFFRQPEPSLDGLIIAAEEGAAWNVLYPDYAVVVPEPILQRPVGFAVRNGELNWLRFLDRWLDFERLDGSLAELRSHWTEGAGVKDGKPRWCIARDVLGWIE
ncbi:cation:dicarboxylase symporter family transporter [Roseiconus nitratireducens]|uniref:Cation:dicarboxylase symporter family transporter n=1 Tax=Roseiconus nitratireducens TaxID=2605748 RepID=A0A5M6D4G0_9BACT|nr:cation:dicarboxylase symporter family transporter [Roseiconus nitratireducens]KAA5542223.1 cation:dicarboxylase symporter family transporter [Roseiconus nitratireducens]